MKSSGWVIVVFENETSLAGEVAYVKGPFQTYEAATEWAGKHDVDGEWQITFLDPAEEPAEEISKTALT